MIGGYLAVYQFFLKKEKNFLPATFLSGSFPLYLDIDTFRTYSSVSNRLGKYAIENLV